MTISLEPFSKEELISKFKDIQNRGWIENYRGRNDGAVGNILEDLLGIQENNLPIPNAAEWELKAQRATTSSLLTLFHFEPSPTALKVVSNILLPKYGWEHQEAGYKYPITEKSFRATLNAASFTDRGFSVNVNDAMQKVEIVFDSNRVDNRHSEWLNSVESNVGHLDDFDVVPYWGFYDLFHKAGTKLKNCFYVRADVKKIGTTEYFLYNYVLKLSTFSLEKFIDAIRNGLIYIDFDARTGHNHGTKFRLRYNTIPLLYENAEVVIGK